MARNREPVKPGESQSESGEEEDEGGSSEEVESQESDSEPEPEPEQTQTATQEKSQAAAPVPSSTEEEESGSESELESDGPDPIVAPKPVEETPKSSNRARKARSKPNSPEPVPPTKSATAKRPAEEDTAAKDAKKSKKTTAEPETSEKKSNLFQRLWSEDDEIVILKGMIDYTTKNKSDPISDLNAFHDFIKKNLHIDFTRTQLQDKIRRLKKKYENNKSKEKEGKERSFSKPHEQTAYELSKSIWGNENGGVRAAGSPKANGGVVRKGASKKATVVVSGEGEEKLSARRVNSNSGGATMEERMLVAGGELFGLGQGVEGEKEWQKLRLEELQLYLKQLEMRVAQTKLVLGVMERRE